MMNRILGLLCAVCGFAGAVVLTPISYINESFLIFILAALCGLIGLLGACEVLQGTKLNKLFTPNDEEDEL